ncbi:hypothetical protein ABZ829_28180 [Streptomyces xanthochromogenes]|uniref:hypothetical protein n=1 Tax=Streptomyces xanthochromogenes TaxID=67384 RepID=UPI00341C574E
MSTETLTRFLCDAHGCSAAGIGADTITPPQGWTVIKSNAHIPPTPTPNPVPTERRRHKPLSRLERSYGAFRLHTCPQHPDAFNAHHPRTEGHGYNQSVTVACSCGQHLGYTQAATSFSSYPQHGPERLWFQHLPADLRWYLWRGERQWATQNFVRAVDRTVEQISQYRSREDAQSAVDRSQSLYSTPTLVFRDREGDPWKSAPKEEPSWTPST